MKGPIPKFQLVLRIDEGLLEAIDRKAEAENLSRNQMIEKTLAARFDPHGLIRDVTVVMHEMRDDPDEHKRLSALKEHLQARLRAITDATRPPREQMITLSCYNCEMKISTLGMWLEDNGTPECPKCKKKFVALHPEYH